MSMEHLNQYLQMLMSKDGYELHLEPNKNPYLISAGGQQDVAETPLLGTQISMMVFPLIPPEVKGDLPNLPTIQFVHPHNLGKFSFTIQKSPAGFNVTVRPILGNPLDAPVEAVRPDAVAVEPPTAVPHVETADVFSFESSSIGRESSFTENVVPVSDLLIEDRDALPKIEIGDGPAIEVIPANDPQFQTVFS